MRPPCPATSVDGTSVSAMNLRWASRVVASRALPTQKRTTRSARAGSDRTSATVINQTFRMQPPLSLSHNRRDAERQAKVPVDFQEGKLPVNFQGVGFLKVDGHLRSMTKPSARGR